MNIYLRYAVYYMKEIYSLYASLQVCAVVQSIAQQIALRAYKKWRVWSNYLAVNRQKEKIPANRIDESDMYWNRARAPTYI